MSVSIFTVQRYNLIMSARAIKYLKAVAHHSSASSRCVRMWTFRLPSTLDSSLITIVHLTARQPKIYHTYSLNHEPTTYARIPESESRCYSLIPCSPSSKPQSPISMALSLLFKIHSCRPLDPIQSTSLPSESSPAQDQCAIPCWNKRKTWTSPFYTSLR